MRGVFIVSTGRTGTKFLADFFADEFPETISTHEPLYSRHFRILSNMYASGVASRYLLKLCFRWTRNRLYRNQKATFYIESNNFLYGYSGLFKELIPDYRIIHVVREPRDYIKSHLNHGVFEGKKLLAKKYLPYWFMNVNKRLGVSRELNHYELLAGRWVLVNEFIESACKGDPNYICIKYEDLFGSNQPECLESLCKFIGLEVEQGVFSEKQYQRVNAGIKKVSKGWKNWKKEDVEKVLVICEGMMKKYGYSVQL